MGNVHFAKKQYDRALAYYNMDLGIKTRVFGTNNIEVAETYYCIGNVHFEKGNLKSALEYFRKDLEIITEIKGKYHSDVARTYNNLGVIFRMMKEYEKAITCYEQSLEIKAITDAGDNTGIANTCYNLGVLYKEYGDDSNARLYLLKAYDLYQKSSPTEHKKNLAEIQQLINQLDIKQKIEKHKAL